MIQLFFAFCWTCHSIIEDIIVGITNAAPLVKLGTIKFLEKAALITYIDVEMKNEDVVMES